MMKRFFPLSILCIAAASLGLLSACSSSGDEIRASDGERISILSVKKSLEDVRSDDIPVMKLPEAWKNAFWPQAGGYPNHAMQHVELGQELERVWTKRIGLGLADNVPLTVQPIVVNGKVIAMDARSLIRAYDLENGDLVWEQAQALKSPEDSVIAGGLAFGDRRLFVTTGYNELLSLDLNTGEILWRAVLSGPSQIAPSVLDGRVYVQTIDNKLSAFDVNDGKALWDYAVVAEGTGIVGGASPAVNRDLVVGAFSSGEVTALRVGNGSVLWSEVLDSNSRLGGVQSIADIRAMPVIDKGLLIAVNFGGQMAAFDVRSGNRIWQRNIGGITTPWVAGNMIFVTSSDDTLVALNRETGLVYWTLELPDAEDKDVVWQAPVLAGGRLIVASSAGDMLELKPGSGDVIRRWQVPQGTHVPLVIAGGRLVHLSYRGDLRVYKTSGTDEVAEIE